MRGRTEWLVAARTIAGAPRAHTPASRRRLNAAGQEARHGRARRALGRRRPSPRAARFLAPLPRARGRGRGWGPRLPAPARMSHNGRGGGPPMFPIAHAWLVERLLPAPTPACYLGCVW